MRRLAVVSGIGNARTLRACRAQAHNCTHGFLWPWDASKWPGKDMGQQPVPHLLERKFLIYVINGLLSCSAVLFQPVWLTTPALRAAAPAAALLADGDGDAPSLPLVALVPLPLTGTSPAGPNRIKCSGAAQRASGSQLLAELPVVCVKLESARSGSGTVCRSSRADAPRAGLWLHNEEPAVVTVPASLQQALRSLGLERIVGHLRLFPAQMCCLPAKQHAAAASARDAYFVPYAVSLGVPLYKPALCKEVCA